MQSRWMTAIIGFVAFSGLFSTAFGAEVLENLALKAKVSASSEYDGRYLARWAVDGHMAPPLAAGANDLEAISPNTPVPGGAGWVFHGMSL